MDPVWKRMAELLKGPTPLNITSKLLAPATGMLTAVNINNHPYRRKMPPKSTEAFSKRQAWRIGVPGRPCNKAKHNETQSDHTLPRRRLAWTCRPACSSRSKDSRTISLIEDLLALPAKKDHGLGFV